MANVVFYLFQDGAEIELDIDELDPHTLFKLYKYVDKNAPELPTKYVPPPPPPQDALHETKAKSKPGPKGRKNKPMTAAEQEAKIKDIESRLHSFENPQAYTPAAPGMYIVVSSQSPEYSNMILQHQTMMLRAIQATMTRAPVPRARRNNPYTLPYSLDCVLLLQLLPSHP